MLKRTYNISLDDYNKLLEIQDNTCAICNKEETQQSNYAADGPDSLRVDHCHSTGKVRGLLCAKCNFGIGQFNDNVALIEKAIEYIKSHHPDRKYNISGYCTNKDQLCDEEVCYCDRINSNQ